MKAFRLLSAGLLSLLFLVLACSRYGNELQYIRTAKVEVYVTDAPFPYEWIAEANITLVKIDARAKDSGKEDEKFEVLFEGEQTVNLIELTNGITHYMGEAEIPVGNYDLIRVYVSEASLKLKDGAEYSLKVPSGAQTGIKFFVKPELVVVGELTNEILLDFDLSRSFVLQGNPDTPAGIKGFSFKPVVKVVNMSTTGTLKGLVSTEIDGASTGLEGAQINVMAADTLNTTTYTDASGLYTVMGLTAGEYEIISEKEGYLSSDPATVTIVPGNAMEQDFELTVE